MTTMLAGVVTALGAVPQAMSHPVPQPRDGEALIEVTAAALNTIDLLISSGRHPVGAPATPLVPGVEGVGRVVRASRLEPGTRVRFALHGGFVSGAVAQYTAVPEEGCVVLPDELDDARAAAIGTVGVSALVSLRKRASVGAGERVLVLGGTGAFGQMLIQVAKVLGAGRVVACGRRADRLEALRSLGADAVFALPPPPGPGESTGWLAQLARERFDVVVDPLWGPYAAAGLACLEPGGRLLNVGQEAGPVGGIPGSALRSGATTITGFSGTSLSPQASADAYREIVRYLLDGALVVHPAMHPLADIEAAWRAQAASPGNKIVIELPPTA